MTPDEVVDYCRRVTNTVNDTAYITNQELIENYLYDACLQISELVPCVQTRNVDSSVATTRSYTRPTSAIYVQSVTYKGQKLQRITMRQENAYEGNDTATRASGTPHSYYEFGAYIYLYPTPDTTNDTIEIFTVDVHPVLTTSSTTLSIPTEWHTRLCNYVIAQIYLKDQDSRAMTYLERWEKIDKPWMLHAWRKKQNRDKMRVLYPMGPFPASGWGVK